MFHSMRKIRNDTSLWLLFSVGDKPVCASQPRQNKLNVCSVAFSVERADTLLAGVSDRENKNTFSSELNY